MARDSSGKWVARAGATGGGRTYRGQVPVNWYAAIVIIVVLGIVSVIFARYEYQNKSSTSNSTQPAVGTTWYAGYQFDICGTPAAPPASNASTATKTGFFTTGSGVITIKPLKAGQAGTNATFSRFVDGYPPMVVSETKVRVPNQAEYTNGEVCPKGTPDAGKKGRVVVLSWSNALLTKEKPVTVQGDPGALRFSQNQLISVGFLPEGKLPSRPSGSVVIALLNASNANGSTSTTAPTGSTVVTTPTGSTVIPTPTVPSTSATTAPAATPTTSVPASPSTTAPKK